MCNSIFWLTLPILVTDELENMNGVCHGPTV